MNRKVRLFVVPVLAVGLILALGAAKGNPRRLTQEQLEGAALDNLYPQWAQVEVSALGVWLGDDTRKDIDAAQAKCDDWRKWASKLTDQRVAAAYRKWIRYFERDIKAAREEMRTGKIKKEQEEFDRRFDAEQAEDARNSTKIPAPPPGRNRIVADARERVRPVTIVAELPVCGRENQGAASLVSDVSSFPDCRTGGGVHGPNFLAECRCKPEGWVVESMMWTSTGTIDALSPGESAAVSLEIH